MTEAPKGRRIATLRLVREGCFVAPGDYPERLVQLNTQGAISRVMLPYVEREIVEVFWLLALDAQMRLIRGALIVITRGILNSAPVHPREVFTAAPQASAMSIVAVHSHPSGDPTPSPDDSMITRQLVVSGEMIGIPLLDHVIVGRGRYVSFAEPSLL